MGQGRSRHLSLIAWGGALSSLGLAQTPFVPDANPAGRGAPPELAGARQNEQETIRLLSGQKVVPLKHRRLVSGTVSVKMGSQPLRQGVDYNLDLNQGTLYLLGEWSDGESLQVSYSFLEAGFDLPKSVSYDGEPGGLRMILNLGAASQGLDGQTTQSNLYGWQHQFSFGRSGFRGVYLYSERTLKNTEDQDPQSIEKSDLILQRVETGMVGGQLYAEYQSVAQEFNGFEMLGEAGLSAAESERLKRQRGFKRYALGFEALSLGFLKFDLQTRSYQEQSGARAGGQELRLYNDVFSLSAGTQETDTDFRGAKAIAKEERRVWSPYAGLAQGWYTLEAKLFGLKQPLRYQFAEHENATAPYAKTEYSAGDKQWAVQETRFDGTGWEHLGQSLSLRDRSRTEMKLEQMRSESQGGSAGRELFDYKSPDLDVRSVRRNVDPGYYNHSEVKDPELGLLLNLRGFDQNAQRVRWQTLPGLRLTGSLLDLERNGGATRDVDHRALFFTGRQLDSLGRPFGDYGIDRLNRTRFGAFWEGRGSFQTESEAFEAFAEGEASGLRQTYSALELQSENGQQLLHEEATVQDERGQRTIQAEYFSTPVGGGLGVNLGRTQVEAESESEQTHLGAWYDLFRTLRLRYGAYAAPMEEETVGMRDRQGLRSQNQFSLETLSPLGLGPLRDVRFELGMNRPLQEVFSFRERQFAKVETTLLTQKLGFEYETQEYEDLDPAVNRRFHWATAQGGPLSARLSYTIRTTPWQEDEEHLRNYALEFRPTQKLAISNEVVENPENQANDVLFGSTFAPQAFNRWRVEWQEEGFALSANWDQTRLLQQGSSQTMGGLELRLFERLGSPLKLFYGLEQSNDPYQQRMVNRYSVEYTQRTGPNQSFNFFVGNVQDRTFSAEFRNALDETRVRLDYQLRF